MQGTHWTFAAISANNQTNAMKLVSLTLKITHSKMQKCRIKFTYCKKAFSEQHFLESKSWVFQSDYPLKTKTEINQFMILL